MLEKPNPPKTNPAAPPLASRILTAWFVSAGLLLTAIPASATKYLQCVPFARELSGVVIYGDAHTWWRQAAGKYARGQKPKVGSVMSFKSTSAMPLGHIAVVSKIKNSRELLISHANWSPINGRRGQIERNVLVRDVSDSNDWSAVRVWYAPTQDLGVRINPLNGFIYPVNPGKDFGKDAVPSPKKDAAPAVKLDKKALKKAEKDKKSSAKALEKAAKKAAEDAEEQAEDAKKAAKGKPAKAKPAKPVSPALNDWDRSATPVKPAGPAKGTPTTQKKPEAKPATKPFSSGPAAKPAAPKSGPKIAAKSSTKSMSPALDAIVARLGS